MQRAYHARNIRDEDEIIVRHLRHQRRSTDAGARKADASENERQDRLSAFENDHVSRVYEVIDEVQP